MLHTAAFADRFIQCGQNPLVQRYSNLPLEVSSAAGFKFL
uniref:Uncharacterized protein n=1 Tax=Anguilla anguilla TaxID=7936 RepID=A0A0E9Q4J4_ANGAN